MTKKNYSLHRNPVVKWLEKDPSTFTREDIINYIVNNGITMVNFMYPAADGRLKTLNFEINDIDYLETILTMGERVDGSSLFRHIEAGNSDLYVIPRYSTAFEDPFSTEPALNMLCTFFDKNGNVLDSVPNATLDKACREFTQATGLEFHAMGELEYYVIGDAEEHFPATDQRNYHESEPFAKFNDFRVQCMDAIARCGGQIKYGHSEVGNFTLDGKVYEQNEVEFLPVDARHAADQLVIAKWVIRNMARREGLDVTFAPKITTGKAGSGLHIHMRLMRDGRNVMLDDNLQLSDDARRLIAGMMVLAPSITAFGNANPTSYFRLVPHQEAPTNVCWGDRNRSVLVRVPLGWNTREDMSAIANPQQEPTTVDPTTKQTVEIRSADCSADVYQLIAALAVAARHGFEMPDALKTAADTYVDVNIHDAANADRLATLATLPVNCADSASRLEQQRDIYENKGVFSPAMIDSVIERLRGYHDENLAAEAKSDPAMMASLVKEYFYCG